MKPKPSEFQVSLKPLFFLTIYICLATYSFGQPTSTQGILDARGFDFKTGRLSLSGEWTFLENQLIFPNDSIQVEGVFTEFPGVWNDTKSIGQGFATYSLNVIISLQSSNLALEIPAMYSSYQLWVNGKIISKNGVVGRTKDQSIPQWLPKTVLIDTSTDTLEIVLQIANFHHHKGGSKDPIYLGTKEMLQGNYDLAFKSNLVESILLIVFGLFFLILYFTTGFKKIVIYFSLLCITWAIRAVFSNLYIITFFFPDFDWDVMVKIEYVTLFFTMIWGILFLSRVFVKEDNKIIKYLLVTSNSLFVTYTILSLPISFTRWLPVYLAFCGVLIVYAAFLVLKGLVNDRLGAGFLTVTIFLELLVFSYDIFSYEGFISYSPLVLSSCYIIIFSLMAVVLLLHLNIIKSKPKPTDRLTFNEMYKNRTPSNF